MSNEENNTLFIACVDDSAATVLTQIEILTRENTITGSHSR